MLLYLSTELIGAGGGRERTVVSGDPVLVTGYIENRANNNRINIDPLLPIHAGPLGNGNPVPKFRLLASGPQGGCTIPLQGTLDPGQKVEFQALVQTYIGAGTQGTINYMPSGTLIDDQGNETQIPPEKIRIQSDTLPYTLHLDDSDPVAPDLDLLTGVVAFSQGALVAVPQWVTSFFSSVAESPITVSELLGKGLVSLPQSAEYVANYFEGIWADPGARENLYDRVSQDIADATGKTIDEVRPQVAASIQAWAQPFYDAWERSDYETALPMLGQLTTNVGLEIATCYAKLPEAARFVELAEQVKETGLAKRLSEGLQALKAGDAIGLETLQQLFGIASEQAGALGALAKEKGLLITARFRQGKSLEWIEAFLAVLKPERIKIKNVDEIDELFLGYTGYTDPPSRVASVVLKRPLDFADARAEELYALSKSDKTAFEAAVDSELSRYSGAYSGATDELKAAARSRLKTRIKEWVSPDQGYAKDLMGLSEAERIPLPWNYRDNFLPGTSGLPGTYTERRFALQAVEGEADHWIVQIGDKDGVLRPVTGDIDIVGIQKANGKGLSAAERAEIYKTLQETTGMQHPDTATWIGPNGEVLFETKAGLLADHAPRGEPLVQFSPDGQQRAVFISPQMSYFNTATGDAHLWYVGGYRQPKPAVFQVGAGTSIGVYFPDKPIPKFVPYVVPGHWVLDGVQGGNWTDGAMGQCTVSFGDGTGATIISPDGHGGLQQYVPGNPLGTWQTYDTSKCRGGGNSSPMRRGLASNDSHIVLLPQSGLATATEPGAAEIDVVDLHSTAPEFFTGPGSEFRVGERIVINPGADTEESATIAELGPVIPDTEAGATIVALQPIILDKPLQDAHEQGEMVTVVSPPGCVGDCNSSDAVTVDELLTMVTIALGNTPVTACAAGDANHDGQITVDEILAAVNNALNGCP